MPLTDSLRDDILASVPSLRAFAISLSGNGDRADDLVQETLLRALANINSFHPGGSQKGGSHDGSDTHQGLVYPGGPFL